MGTPPGGRRARFTAYAVAAVLFSAGTLTLGAGIEGHPVPAPVPASAIPAAVPARPTSSAPASAVAAPPVTPAPPGTQAPPEVPASSAPAAPGPAVSGPDLAASIPVTLDIPQIGVHTNLLQLGQAADGTADVPPGDPGSPAGWYKYSPTPGEPGPSVILGHVNSTVSNIGVFYRLHELAPGQQFTVTRADRTAAVFQIDRTAEFPKDRFPTLEVYGNTDRPEIRLITCGGYDRSSGLYTENTVVYAHLVASHPV